MDARRGAALAALGALLLGACGSSSAAADGSPGSPRATASPSPTAGLGAVDAGTLLGALAAQEDGSELAARAKDPSAPLTPAVVAALVAAGSAAAARAEPSVTGVAVTDTAVLTMPGGASVACVVASRTDPTGGTAPSWAVVAKPGGRVAVLAGSSCAAVRPAVAALLPRMDSASPPSTPVAGDAGAWAAGMVLTRAADYDAIVLSASPAGLTPHGQEYVARYRSQTAQRLLWDADSDAAALARRLDDVRAQGGSYPTEVTTTTTAGTQTVVIGGKPVVLGPGGTLTALATTRARDGYCLRVTTSDGQHALYESGVGLVGIPPLECSTARYPRTLLP